MIWLLLCAFGRHDWRPVFRHHSTDGRTLRSLVRCARRRMNGGPCGSERYVDSTMVDWRRGGQL